MSIPLVKKIADKLNIYEIYGTDWNLISHPICQLNKIFDDFCDSHSFVNVKYNDYNDEMSARI